MRPSGAVPAALLLCAALIGRAAAQSYKFDFGPGAAAEGFTKVTAATRYSASLGYGFEGTGTVTEADRGGDALRGDFITGAREIFFSVKVPQGNYAVTFHLGDASGASTTTVKAENKRLLFDRATTASGQFLARTITVNRREVRSTDGSVTMSIKDRELTYWTWDDRLTLRFSGSKPAVGGVEITKVNDAASLYLCGNSTVVDQLDGDETGWCSWGQMITRAFKPGLAVANYAESGLDAAAFLGMNRLAKILAEVKEGEYVFVEFGHNDQGNGLAPYQANLKKFRDQIVAKKAIPVFVSPTSRKGDADPKTSIGGLAEGMRATAAELGVTLIDLNAMSVALMKALGSSHTAAYMDVSHFTDFGAFELSRCVVKGIREKNLTIAAYLTDDLPAFDPVSPDPVNYFSLPGTVGILPAEGPGRGAAAKLRLRKSGGESSLIGFQAGSGDGTAPHAADGKRLPQ